MSIYKWKMCNFLPRRFESHEKTHSRYPYGSLETAKNSHHGDTSTVLSLSTYTGTRHIAHCNYLREVVNI